MDKSRIAILYITTGKYFVFWDRFYESARQFLFADKEKELKFFVFTDKDRELGKDVKVTVVDNEPWPYPTLKRYHYFLQLEKELRQFDYIYFFNGNTVFLRSVGEEILPKNGTGFAFVHQPFTLTQKNTEFGYERRPQSKAFIANGTGLHYIWGAFNGGRSESFLKMAKVISAWTDEDLKIPLITAFWDESYINRYLLELERNQYTLVDPGLFLVDGYNETKIEAQTSAAIHILEKSRFFDTSFKQERSFGHRIKVKVKRLLGIN